MSRRAWMIIPAAGHGTRLGSPTPKLLATVNGKAMVDHLLDLYAPYIEHFVLVLQPAFEDEVRTHCSNRAEPITYARQDRPTGMLDAILAPLPQVRETSPGRVWITWCDQVGIDPQTIQTLKRLSDDDSTPAALVFPTARANHPYVHVVRDEDDRIVDVLHRREGDRMPDVGESDMGLFSLSGEAYGNEVVAFSAQAGKAGQTGERNFLPFIPWLARRGASVRTFRCRDEREAIGVNTMADLRTVERYLLERDGQPMSDA